MRVRAAGHSTWSVVAACTALAACVPTPPSQPRPARTALPATFGAETGPGADAASADATANSATTDWREFFGDPHLVALIDYAMQNNQELAIAVQEMIVANARVMARRGDVFPSLALGIEAGLERVGQYTSQGQSDEHLGLGADLPTFSLGLLASWEVDVWGRLRDRADAEMYRYLATAEGRHFVITRLVAEIASQYYELLALDRALAILDDNVRLMGQALEMMRLQQQAGRVPMLAVTRFEGQLRGFESRRYEIAQRIVATENQINLLLGRFPQPIERTDADFFSISPPTVHAGTPAALLVNRPDVRQAELALQAARLDVSAARARFFPSLTIEAGGGVASFDIVQLVTNPGSIVYTLLGGITAPLLNRSEITAEWFASNAEQMAAVLRYERAILSAYIDVRTALALRENATRAYELRAQQVARLAESVDLSTMLFNAARADYLEVLTARRDLLEAQMDLVETKQRQLVAAVTLYQALGGGWRRDGEAVQDPAPMGAAP